MMLTKLISVAQVSQNIICILQNINAGIYHKLDQKPWSLGLKRRCRTTAFIKYPFFQQKTKKKVTAAFKKKFYKQLFLIIISCFQDCAFKRCYSPEHPGVEAKGMSNISMATVGSINNLGFFKSTIENMISIFTSRTTLLSVNMYI